MAFDLPWLARDPDTRLLITITGSYPVAFTIYFTDRPIIDATIPLSGGSSLGMCAAFKVQEFALSGESSANLSVAIRNATYTATSPTVPADLKTYANLSDMLGHYILHGASVRIKQYCTSPGHSASETLLAASWTDGETLYWGSVSTITNLTAQDVTLHITSGAMLRQSQVPVKIVGSPDIAYAPAEVPDVSKGLPIPVRLGRRMNPPPLGWEAIYTSANDSGISYLLARSGIPHVGMMPVRMIGVDSLGSPRLAWQEKPYDMSSYGQYSPGDRLFKMLPEIDALGQILDTKHGSSESDATAEGYYREDLGLLSDPGGGRRPTLTTYMTPGQIIYTSASGVTNPGYAIDRKLTTYTKLQGSNVEVRYRMPSIGNLGAIKPINGGIRLLALTAYRPPGSAANALGTFYMGIKEPFEKPGATWQFNSPPPTGGMIALSATSSPCGLQNSSETYQSVIYDTPRYTEWRGTSWQAWDFTSSNDPDDPTWLNSTDYAGLTFDVCVQTNGAAIVYLIGLFIAVTFVLDKQDYELYKPMDKVGASWADNWKDGYRPRVKSGGHAGPRGIAPRWGGTMWPRTGISGGYQEKRPTDPEGYWAYNPSYYDSANAFGGGVGWLEHPGSIINYLMRNYAHPKTGITVGTTFGNVGWFNSQLSAWSGLHVSGESYTFDDLQIDSQESVASAIQRVFMECPGNARMGHGTDGTPTLLAETWDGTSDLSQMAHASVSSGGLLPYRDILIGSDRPAIEIQYTNIEDVINKITINYAYSPTTRKYGSVASLEDWCSDDGFGVGWPACPGSGISCDALAAISIQHFGGVREAKINLQGIWNRAGAVAVGISLLWRNWRPMAKLHFAGGMGCHDMVPGQIITMNDAVRTTLGLPCSILFRASNTWTNFYWVIDSITRVDEGPDGRGVFYDVYAYEHLNGYVGPVSGMTGHPGPFGTGEGFDI